MLSRIYVSLRKNTPSTNRSCDEQKLALGGAQYGDIVCASAVAASQIW